MDTINTFSHLIVMDLWSKERVDEIFSKVIKNTEMETMNT